MFVHYLRNVSRKLYDQKDHKATCSRSSCSHCTAEQIENSAAMRDCEIFHAPSWLVEGINQVNIPRSSSQSGA